MEAFVTSKNKSKGLKITWKVLLLAFLLALLPLSVVVYFSHTSPQQTEDNQLKMEKSSGKNGKHANPKARESAEQEYQKVKDELQEWSRKPNKTPEDKDYIKKLRKMLEKLRQKKDFSGENHSQKHKGF